MQVIACAGAGKTEAISRRVARLIAQGAEPESIVAFTFTERAAGELKNRIAARVTELLGSGALDRVAPMFVGTMHGYCFRLLQDHVPQYGNYDVLDEHRHAGLLSREYQRIGLSKLGARHWSPIHEWIRTVDVIGNELIGSEALEGTAVGEVYLAYRQMLDRYHFLTFGLIISAAIDALHDPATFARVRAPLRYLFVDEYQDVNPAQERLVELLAMPPVSLCVVGDDDQAIYQWRGSDVRNIVQFTTRRTGAGTVTLDENRRSRPEIVARANAFAQTIPGRLAKFMHPVRAGGLHQVVNWTADTDLEEAARLAATIERLHTAGHRYRDIAVLYRSVRTSAPPLIAELEARGIPYECGGRTGLFLRAEVALFGELFAWMADGEWRDERFGQSRPASLDHVVSGLEREFGGAETIEGLRRYLEDWKLFRLRGQTPVSLVGDYYKLLERLGARGIDPVSAAGAARLGALARFSHVLADFEHVTRRGRYIEENGKRTFRGGRSRGKPFFQALQNYLLHYARDAYEEWAGDELSAADAVDILTVHQAKGLEWPVVFLPSLVDGRFPARRSGSEQKWLLSENVFPKTSRTRYEGGDGEERRLFYVAVTRARDCVFASTFERKTNKFKPSPYFTEFVAGTASKEIDLPIPAAPGTVNEDDAPLDVSFSEVALFEDCGYRYQLASVLGFQQELAVELGYGKAIHHVLRQVAEAARSGGAISDDTALRELVDDEFYLPFADAPAFIRMHRSAVRLVSNYVTDHADDLRRVWAVERPFELNLPEGRVSGRADVILDAEGGKKDALAIVDYKISSDPEYDARYRRQLAVYAAAARGEGLNVRAGYLHELRDGARYAVDVGQWATASAMTTLAGAVRDIRAGEYTPRPELNRCKHCDYCRLCAHRYSS